jgi:RES domain-containing protein
MAAARRGHDDRLLDALAEIDPEPFAGTMWRVVRAGRSVGDGSRGSGRWNPTSLSVLYGAQEADGAIAEMHFHLSRGQSVFPSRMQHLLFELRIRTTGSLVLADMDALGRLGVVPERYGEILYDRTQEIADAAFFMGYDGIIAPSARWPCRNVVLFLDRIDLDGIEELSSSPIDWAAWRMRTLRNL